MSANILFIAALISIVGMPVLGAINRSPESSDWVNRFSFHAPTAETSGKISKYDTKLPSFTYSVNYTGEHLTRVSLPFPCGSFPTGRGLIVNCGNKKVTTDVRVLTYHQGSPSYVRRAIITFPFNFQSNEIATFKLSLDKKIQQKPFQTIDSDKFAASVGDYKLEINRSSIRILNKNKPLLNAGVIAPLASDSDTPRFEVIEQSKHYLWVRELIPDIIWPRIIEVQMDSTGQISAKLKLQSLEKSDGYTPDLGWNIVNLTPQNKLSFPEASEIGCGSVSKDQGSDSTEVKYLAYKETDKAPYQISAWREAVFSVESDNSGSSDVQVINNETLLIPAEYFDSIYSSGKESDLKDNNLLYQISKYHRDIIVESALKGVDFGNVTAYPANYFGMNRLNHCPTIFMEYYRSSDERLLKTALDWCRNFFNLSIWWGTSITDTFGGTRYNNGAKLEGIHIGDKSFMWRSNSAIPFCTKGIDSFFYAYEETGDPDMANALYWQVEYAKKNVHAGRSYCRDIGSVKDFIRLYNFTGKKEYLNECFRLFNDLRGCLSEGDLFTESGLPIEKDPPFINDDSFGSNHPFAKPYILGYALWGLPDLLQIKKDEPKLYDVVKAVANYMAKTVDPAGGWRYPSSHSQKLFVGQGIEHAAELSNAAKYLESQGEDINKYLDAIEKVLQARILSWQKSGQFITALDGWENSSGIIGKDKSIYDLYKKPEDRDPSRDYTEGKITLGSIAPDGVVYFWQVLDFYLSHRSADRLMHLNDKLKLVLERVIEK